MNIYYDEFINFFKKHNLYNEEIFEYIKNNSTHFDYIINQEQRPFIGCYYIRDKKNILKKIKICVPFIDSKITVLINIHEYIHAIEQYRNIGKKYKQKQTEEILPMLYELLYFLENPNKELENHLTSLNNEIDKSYYQTYKIALAIQKELLEYYQRAKPNFNKLQTKAKKLSRKFERDNR